MGGVLKSTLVPNSAINFGVLLAPSTESVLLLDWATMAALSRACSFGSTLGGFRRAPLGQMSAAACSRANLQLLLVSRADGAKLAEVEALLGRGEWTLPVMGLPMLPAVASSCSRAGQCNGLVGPPPPPPPLPCRPNLHPQLLLPVSQPTVVHSLRPACCAAASCGSSMRAPTACCRWRGWRQQRTAGQGWKAGRHPALLGSSTWQQPAMGSPRASSRLQRSPPHAMNLGSSSLGQPNWLGSLPREQLPQRPPGLPLDRGGDGPGSSSTCLVRLPGDPPLPAALRILSLTIRRAVPPSERSYAAKRAALTALLRCGLRSCGRDTFRQQPVALTELAAEMNQVCRHAAFVAFTPNGCFHHLSSCLSSPVNLRPRDARHILPSLTRCRPTLHSPASARFDCRTAGAAAGWSRAPPSSHTCCTCWQT